MAARVLAQALVVGGTILVRAFGAAYQKALQNAAKNGGGDGAARAKDKTVRMLKGLTVIEAESILGIESKVGLVQIIEKADRMYANNDKEKGGSIYIQSKVLNAKDCLEMHLGEVEEDAKAAEAAARAEEEESGGGGGKPQP